ncbi:MAG: hypothetical protein RLZ32_1594 [Gemmatimonadota bacterium]|jgi:hypothetical protein
MLRWLFLATLSAILLLQLRGLDEPLRTPETPQGIVGFELAGTRAEAARMLAAWRSAGVLEAAKVSLGVDMGFLLAYPFFLRSTMGLLRRRVRAGRLAWGGDWLVRAVLLCVPLDLAENLLLWRMVDGGATAWGAAAAAACAGVKFLLVAAAVGWSLMALVAGWRGRRPAG